MTQVAAADVLRSMKDCYVGYSTDGTSFTDISGYATAVTPSGGERASGEAYTFSGDKAVLGWGKRAPVELTGSLVYTEKNTDPYYVIRAAYENCTTCYLRIGPKGGDAGEWLWTSELGIFTRVSEPGGEASAGDPVVCEWTFRTSAFNKTNAAS